MRQTETLLPRVLLLSVLAVIVGMNCNGERVAVNDGFGWDGIIYRDIVCHLEEHYFSGGINSYHMHRILPFAMIHFIIKWTGIGITDANILRVAMWQNIVMLGLSVACFFRLSRLFRWKQTTEVMAFSLMFFTFPVLKYMGYYPLLTDTMALFLSFATACCYFDRHLRHRSLWLSLLGIISMTVWPVLSVVVLFLVALPSGKPCGAISSRTHSAPDLPTLTLRMVYVLWVPMAFAAYVWYRMCYRGADDISDVFVRRPTSSVWLLPVAAAAWMAVMWRAAGMLLLPAKPLAGMLLERKNLCRLIASCAVFLLLYRATGCFGGPSVFSLTEELVCMSQLPLTDVLIFLEAPFAYLGCFFLLTVCYWREICQEAHRHGMSILAVTMLALFFLADTETRKLIAFYPFLLILLANALERRPFPRWMPATTILLQLALSCFWLQINTDGIAQAFADDSIAGSMNFPAQRYFMFFGPWQSHQMYLLFLTVELVILAALLLTKQRCKHEA